MHASLAHHLVDLDTPEKRADLITTMQSCEDILQLLPSTQSTLYSEYTQPVNHFEHQWSLWMFDWTVLQAHKYMYDIKTPL